MGLWVALCPHLPLTSWEHARAQRSSGETQSILPTPGGSGRDHKMGMFEEKCPPTQGPAKQASPSKGRGWSHHPQPSSVPFSLLSHPEGTLGTEGAPGPKGGHCAYWPPRPRAPQESCCRRGHLARQEEAVMAVTVPASLSMLPC